MKYLILTALLLTSCGGARIVKYTPEKPKIQTRQEKMIECMEILRRLAFTEDFIGKTCQEIFRKI